jgi:DNA-binding winged helix-turn-helix (wHTH) protein/Tfp pilus assembly protein PilF
VTDATEFHFDGWTLRSRSGELVRDGNTQRLPQQPLRVLVELLNHPGDVVTRERLVEVLWPKGVVDFDNSLNAVVRKLRVVLGDDSGTPRYIETLPRIGYRFVGKLEVAAPVSAVDDAPASSVSTAPEAPQAEANARPVRHRHLVTVGLAAVMGIAGLTWWLRGPKPVLPVETPAVESAEPKRTSSQRAYELYLNGKFQRSRRDLRTGTWEAIKDFEAALKEDPYFVDAWAALAETYVGAGITQQLPVTDAMEKGRSSALRAIELDPKSAAGHSALGIIAMNYDLDYAKAEKELLASRASDESYARMWHGLGLLRAYQGRVEDAFMSIGHARELESTQLLYAGSYANLLYHTRRYAEAIEYARSLLSSQPRFDAVRAVLIRALVASGDANGALEQLPLRFAEVPFTSEDGLAYAHAGGVTRHWPRSSG